MSMENFLENHLYTKAAQKRIPISGTFELLPVCNLDCKMCYIKKSMSEVKQAGGLRTADEWISLGKRATDAGMLFLLLTGGEPFLYPELEKLYTSLHKYGLAIDINSNGTLINESHIAWLKKNQPRHIKISLYGSTPDSYGSLCGSQDAFHKTIHAFELLKSAGITVYSSITVTPSNFSELDDMLQLCEDFHIPVKATSYMFPPLRSSKNHILEEYRLSPYDAAAATLKIVKHTNDVQTFYDRAKEYSDDAYQSFMDSIPPCGECGHMECRGGTCTFWVTWEGNMLPCAMMDIGNLPVMGDHDFLSSWKQINTLAQNIHTAPACNHCIAKKACYACAASSYCETGSTQQKSEYVCEMTQHYLKLMKQEYQKYSALHTEG